MRRRRKQIAILAGAGLLAVQAALWACGSTRPGDVLLITIDTLRPDHLGLYGYQRPTSPQLDRWLADAAIFDRAYSTEANTSPSVVSLLSGLHPPEHRVRLFYQLVPDATRLLPELLPRSYVSAGFVANVVLSDDALGIANRFDHYDDDVDEIAMRGMGGKPIWERRASRTTDAAVAWLREESDAGRPLFLWVHYIDPHGPYSAPGRQHRDERGETDTVDKVDAYDEEIAYVDAEIGRLLQRFDEIRGLDDSLLILTADHGESMREHELWFTHGYHVYEEIIRVPLAIRGPGVTPGRYPMLVSGVDVAPTILAFAGAEPPADGPGFDLRQPDAIPLDRVVLAEASSISAMFGHWRTVVGRREKWMARMPRGEREIVQRIHYDLEADPHELDPKPWLDAAAGGRRLIEIAESDPDPGGLPEEARRGSPAGAPKVSPRVTDEQLEKLRALGYAEDEPPDGRELSSPRPSR